ncbi:MAG: glycine cleavage system protein GcvH [Chloroflexota bacterium]|nr:glycine cleavage system protein GcvH [Chloroflexota bacterium]
MANYKIDDSAKYALTHEWVRMEEGIAVVGISDAAQDMLSDVGFVELPQVGAVIQAGKAVATVESVKAAEEVIAPLSGTVIEVNEALVDRPELVNEQPYGAWFFKLQPEPTLETELAALMDAMAYAAFAAKSAH